MKKKKTGNPAKQFRKARKGRKSGPKRPNPLKTSMLSDKAMIGIVEEMMWGQFGCALLRSIGVSPIDLTIKAAAMQSRVNPDEASQEHRLTKKPRPISDYVCAECKRPAESGKPCVCGAYAIELTSTDISESPEAEAGEKGTE